MTLYNRINPSTSSGTEDFSDERRRVLRDRASPASKAFSVGLDETNPAEKTKDPTPRSIKDVPQVSTFAKRLGKALKSTARMARHVIIIIPPLYAVMNGLTGNGSDLLRASGILSCFLVAKVLACLLCFPSASGSMYRRTAGTTRRVLSRIAFEEYKVVANKIATALSR